jgi:hypothetical protein
VTHRRDWYRPLELREEGDFAALPLYVRGLAAMLLKYADDDGRIALLGREPWEAVALRCGATVGDRRMLRKDLPVLVAVGALRLEPGALVVTALERTGKRERRERHGDANGEPNRDETIATATRAADEFGASIGNRSNVPGPQGEERRGEDKRGEERKLGERIGGATSSAPPDPPSDRGDGPAPPAPSPLLLEPPALPAPAARKGPAKAQAQKLPPAPPSALELATLPPAERRALDAIAEDPTLRPICRGVPQLAHDLVVSAPHVNVALEVPKAGAWLRANPRRGKSNGNAYLLKWLGRAEQDAIDRGDPLPSATRAPTPGLPPAYPPPPPLKGEPMDPAEIDRLLRQADAELRERYDHDHAKRTYPS